MREERVIELSTTIFRLLWLVDTWVKLQTPREERSLDMSMAEIDKRCP